MIRSTTAALACAAFPALGAAPAAALSSYTDVYSYADHFRGPATVRRSVEDGVVVEDTTSDQGILSLDFEAPGFDESLGTLERVDVEIDYLIPWRVTSSIRGFDETIGGDVSTTVRLTADLFLRAVPDVIGVSGTLLIDDLSLGSVEETAGCNGVPGENCTQQNNFALAAIITSNLPFDEWKATLGDERLTGTLLDRLTHHVHILEMNGRSCRLAHGRKKTGR